MNYNFEEGAALLVDKPLGWTSFDVVNKIRYALRKSLDIRKIKVGHAGTLDPLATGLLIICTGKFTKKIDEYQALYKRYDGNFKLGAITPSYDAETEETELFPIDKLTEKAIYDNVAQFLGDIQQYPPMFSAIKVDGEPLYKLARKGEEIELKPRDVTIYDFKISHIQLPEVGFEVKCSKGTYIRSLAYDFGKQLDNGAYLTKLRRTHIGEHSLENAWNLEELIAYIDNLKK